MRHRARWCAAGLCAVMLATVPMNVLAAGPAEVEIPKYDAETLARLQDNTIEYDELLYLIREYNPAIAEAWKNYEDSKDDMQGMVDEMQSLYHNVEDTANMLMSLPNPEMAAQGAALKKSYTATIRTLKDTVKDWNSDSSTKQLRKVENQALAGAQALMIGYSTVTQNIDTLTTQVQLYQAMYELKQNQAAQEMATQTEVLSAQKDLLSARSSLLSLQVQQSSLLDSLGLLLGWKAGAQPQVMPVPTSDLTRITAMNPEADIQTAIGNNYSLSEQRRSSSSGQDSAHKANRSASIDVGEQNLAIELQRLYQDVLDKKTAYESAITGFQSASLTWDAAQRQYSYGMMSKSQYLGAQVQYFSKKAAKESADLTLFQAMEAYDWAVKGIASVS